MQWQEELASTQAAARSLRGRQQQAAATRNPAVGQFKFSSRQSEAGSRAPPSTPLPPAPAAEAACVPICVCVCERSVRACARAGNRPITIISSPRPDASHPHLSPAEAVCPGGDSCVSRDAGQAEHRTPKLAAEPKRRANPHSADQPSAVILNFFLLCSSLLCANPKRLLE